MSIENESPKNLNHAPEDQRDQEYDSHYLDDEGTSFVLSLVVVFRATVLACLASVDEVLVTEPFHAA